jgi:hypothetical protein
MEALPDSIERGLAASASGALPIDRFTMGLNGIETDRKIAELDDARCGVCDEIAVRATRAACKHIFCEACIYSLLDISLPVTAPLPSVSVGCPRGCGPVDASQLQVAVELRARLQRTTVCCTNTNLGCSYQGPLSECVEHEAQQCAWRRVRCPKCAKKFIARDVGMMPSKESSYSICSIIYNVLHFRISRPNRMSIAQYCLCALRSSCCHSRSRRHSPLSAMPQPTTRVS